MSLPADQRLVARAPWLEEDWGAGASCSFYLSTRFQKYEDEFESLTGLSHGDESPCFEQRRLKPAKNFPSPIHGASLIAQGFIPGGRRDAVFLKSSA